MKILLILTGGTIASVKENGVLDVYDGSQYRIINMYREKYGEETDFTVISLMNILSENIGRSHFEALINCLNSEISDDFDGVIIAHGSDTLPYTGAMLDLYFNSVNLPIILVCSNYPLDDKKSNGFINFCSAVEVIKSKMLKGVFAVYKNSDNRVYLYEGSVLLEADSFFDDFRGFCGALGVVNNSKIKLLREKINPEKTQYSKNIVFKNKVFFIKVTPFADYSAYNFGKDVKAVLLEFYHSATASVEGENSVLPFINECRKKNIDVYFCSMKRGGSVYSSCSEIISSGAIPIYDRSVYSALSFLLLKYNVSSDKTL